MCFDLSSLFEKLCWFIVIAAAGVFWLLVVNELNAIKSNFEMNRKR